jgi:hypothetical protein
MIEIDRVGIAVDCATGKVGVAENLELAFPSEGNTGGIDGC